MKYKTVVGLLAAGFYIDVLLAVNALCPMPPPKLPWFYYPVQPTHWEERNPYENDCWGHEDDYCWYEEYDI